MVRYLLYPFALIYGLVVYTRNRLFDMGVLKSQKGAIKTVVLGNLALGGTGKTPHTEYLIKELRERYHIAVLSRGYGRTSKGFVQGVKDSTTSEIGDEPRQLLSKFPEVKLAVCENRILGIQKLYDADNNLDLVILDDAFQHRRLIGDLNILLTTQKKLYTDSHLLPVGNLRDNKREARRANIVIITKCKVNPDHLEKKTISKKLNLKEHQSLFFSGIKYKRAQNEEGQELIKEDCLVISGVANSTDFENHCKENYNVVKTLAFKDHYHFLASDLDYFASILAKFEQLNGVVLCTEKDYVKLKELNRLRTESIPLFYIPIEIDLFDGEENFKKAIINHLSNE